MRNPSQSRGPRTLYQKIWDAHVVHQAPDAPAILYVDRHYIHEISSPQAFDGLRAAGRKVRRPDLTFGIMDHSVSTKNRLLPMLDQNAAIQFEALRKNCEETGIRLFDQHHHRQGIVHVVGPELGITLPGQVIVCGDSHTSTHGAFGALAFGIGSSEVEHVLATQCLQQFSSRVMLVQLDGHCGAGVTAKDLILAVIGKIGIAGGTGYVIEYAGEAIRRLSMEQRMTVCNMSIEAGARAGLIAPDETTFDYLKDRPFVPQGAEFDCLVESWRSLTSDPGAVYDREFHLDLSALVPQVTWGTSPEMVADVTGHVPDPDSFADPVRRQEARLALDYIGLTAGTPMTDIAVDRVFIGSCTNARIEDLRAAAAVIHGKHVAPSVKQALVVPGSRSVKAQAEREELDAAFLAAGFEWRDSGCSMCVAVNDDLALPGERCASTSNRNFEGRQGKGSRTHLVSPIMAAAAAVEGHFVDVRAWMDKG